jgi:hypothetical protein
MMRRIFLIALASTATVAADPVTWYLSNVTFSDGGRAVGSFTYNQNTGVFSNVNIQSTPGTNVTLANAAGAGGNYRLEISGAALDFKNDVEFSSTSRRLRLLNLNNGGSVPVTIGAQEGFCGDLTTCASTAAGGRSITGGTLEALSSTGPKTWYLSVTFDDGGQAMGSFVFDSNTSTFSNVDISTSQSTQTTAFQRVRYQNVLANSTASAIRLVSALPVSIGTRILTLQTSPMPLTNAAATTTRLFANPATATRFAGVESTCTNPACTSTSTLARTILSGTLTNVPPSNFHRILPHLADGGAGVPFRTELIITNITDTPATYALSFLDDAGAEYTVPGIARPVVATVPPRGVSFVRSNGSTSAPLTQGSGRISGGDNFTVTALFTWIGAGNGIDQQGSVIAESQGTTAVTIPFDATAGAVVGLAVANPSLSPVTVVAVGYDSTGRIIMNDASLTMPAGGHEAFVFSANRYPQLMGQRGHIRLFALQGGSPPYPGINALALKFLPGNSFTTLGATNQ